MDHRLEEKMMQSFSHVADREKAAKYIEHHPHFFDELLALACSPDQERQHIMAAWVLEKYILPRLELLYPLLDVFIEGATVQQHESKRRPMMKILYHYCQNKTFRNALSTQQKDAIATACFGTLLEAKKVAAIAFAMKTLHFFRSHDRWIDEELNAYVERHLPNSSAGFRSVVRQIS